MGTAWGPGRYDKTSTQQAGIAGNGAGGSGCDCNATCCIAKNEYHYQVKTSSGKVAVDAPGTGTLSHRAAMEFYNAGTVTFEVSNQPFVYGDGTGRPVLAGAAYSLQVGPANQTAGTTHYIQGASDPFDCRITELGV